MSSYTRTAAAVVAIGGVLMLPGCSDAPEPANRQNPSTPSDAQREVVVATTMTTGDLVSERVCLDQGGPHVLGSGSPWQTRVETLQSSAGLETLAAVGVLPGDLLTLGMEYMRSKGRPTEYTETTEPHYASGLAALAN